MNYFLLTLCALPPVSYALIYAVHCLKRRKIKAAIGVCFLLLLALCCFIWLLYTV